MKHRQKNVSAPRSGFAQLHPVVQCFYLLAAACVPMFFMHPFFLLSAMLAGLFYSFLLGGKKAAKKAGGFFLLACILILVNPFLNHAGNTILVYVNDLPVTRESIFYGVIFALLLLEVLFWFSCWNRIITSRKLAYLLGTRFPSLSLLFTMVLRLIPRYGKTADEILKGRRGLRNFEGKLSFGKRIRESSSVFSALTTWALENGVDTADSMRARGYGLPGRVCTVSYSGKKEDVVLAAIWGLSMLGMVISLWAGGLKVSYFPITRLPAWDGWMLWAQLFLSVLCWMLLIFDVWEELRWMRLRWKI